VRLIKCPEKDCLYSCLYKASLQRHHLDVHDETAAPRHKCPKCSEAFRTYVALKKHEMTICDASSRPHVCETCGLRFKLKQGLVLHYNEVHKMSAEEARLKVYPDLDVPDWIGKKRIKIHKKDSKRKKTKKQ
jgi:hypothetical protein